MNRKKFLGTLGAGTLAASAVKSVAQSVSAPAASPMSTAITGPAALPSLLTLDDVERLAVSLMQPSVHAYVAGGAADEVTIRWNRERYQTIALRQRILRDTEIPECTTTLFGQRLNHPIL